MTESERVEANETNPLWDWAGFGSGVELAKVVEAPIEVPGWEERPWVRVRCLTEAEALERESLGLIEEYELVTRGLEEPSVSVRRVYDLRAMAEYDFAHAVTDFCLPELRMDQTLVERRAAADDQAGNVLFLGRLQPAVAQWLREVIDRENRRLPEQRATIEQAKKKLKKLGAKPRGERAGLAEVLEGMLPKTEWHWHEGRDFADQAEIARLVRKERTETRVRVPTWALLIQATLRELRLRKEGVTGPEEVAAWKVELWEAFWNGGSGSQEPRCRH